MNRPAAPLMLSGKKAASDNFIRAVVAARVRLLLAELAGDLGPYADEVVVGVAAALLEAAGLGA